MNPDNNLLNPQGRKVFLALLIFCIGTLIAFALPIDILGMAMLILFLFLLIFIIWSIATTPKIKTEMDKNNFDIVYIYKRTNIIPLGSMIFTAISLLWALILNIKKSGVETALAFFTAFAMLLIIESMVKWYKGTKYNGFTFSFNNHGIVISKGSWQKKFTWENYKCFSTLYQARFGKIISYLPIISSFIHETDKYTINLYRKKGYIKEPEIGLFSSNIPALPYDQIITMPQNHQQIVKYISKYLSQEYKKLSLTQRF